MSPLIDMLVQIKNGQAAKREFVAVPFSKLKYDIAHILKNYGFVSNVEKKKKKGRKGELAYLHVGLKYDAGAGVVRGMKFVSKPSRRMYGKAEDMKPVHSGYGISVVTTSKGLMTADEARKNKIGGEILFEIW